MRRTPAPTLLNDLLLSVCGVGSRNLKKFFAVHDSQFVPLVDRLLEEYTGHERLLYARIRRLYCANGIAKRTPG